MCWCRDKSRQTYLQHLSERACALLNDYPKTQTRKCNNCLCHYPISNVQNHTCITQIICTEYCLWSLMYVSRFWLNSRKSNWIQSGSINDSCHRVGLTQPSPLAGGNKHHMLSYFSHSLYWWQACRATPISQQVHEGSFLREAIFSDTTPLWCQGNCGAKLHKGPWAKHNSVIQLSRKLTC